MANTLAGLAHVREKGEGYLEFRACNSLVQWFPTSGRKGFINAKVIFINYFKLICSRLIFIKYISIQYNSIAKLK